MGKSPLVEVCQVKTVTIEELIDDFECKHLSRSRSNGFYSMVKRIRRLAEEHAQ